MWNSASWLRFDQCLTVWISISNGISFGQICRISSTLFENTRCCHTSWHFCRVNSSTHHDMVLRPVANNWLLSDRVSQQWWQKIQQNRTGWSEDHYSQQIKAHAFHCLVCCCWIAQNSPYPIHNIRLFAKIKSRMPSLWQIACVVKTRLQLSPSHDFVILIITK